MQPAVFLDRDNTLIANDGDLGDPNEVRLIDGVAQGLRSLHEAGFRLIVVTNQGGVARGKYTEHDVDAVNQRIAEAVDEAAGGSGLIDRFYYCPYHPEATVEEYRRDHPWRKPHPGMLLQAARDLDLGLERSWLIGDQLRDIQAGHAAGCRTILVGGNGTLISEAGATASVSSFAEAVRTILTAGAKSSAGAGSSALPAAPTEAPAQAHQPPKGKDSSEPMRRTMHELIEELRNERIARTEFTPMKMIAGLTQLLVLLFVLLGLLQLHQTEAFLKWMAGAALLQLFTITILLADRR